MEDIKTEAVRAHTEGRLLEAERSYRILLEQSEDPDAAINLGAGGLLKSGEGALDLTADNTYSGTTNISEGTLLVTGSLPDTSSMSIDSGATYRLGANDSIGSLQGKGNVDLASYMLASGGNNL